METIIAVGLFGLCFAGMSVGVMLSGRRLRGSCGGDPVLDANGEEIACGSCARQEASVCPSDDPLVRLAQIAHPDPKHHR